VGPSDLAEYDAATIGDLLDAVSTDYPLVKSYVLDDQGRVRRHVAIFVDGVMRPREGVLELPLTSGAEVYVLQALSGG
jgi:sulfur carrier protein ThiS